MLKELPPIKENLPEIRALARVIKIFLYKIKEANVGISYKLNKEFSLQFISCHEIYVEENTIYIPMMSIKKLNNLPRYLQKVGLPYVFEHEACHLVDIAFIDKHNLPSTEDISQVRLEKRAEIIESYCIKLN